MIERVDDVSAREAIQAEPCLQRRRDNAEEVHASLWPGAVHCRRKERSVKSFGDLRERWPVLIPYLLDFQRRSRGRRLVLLLRGRIVHLILFFCFGLAYTRWQVVHIKPRMVDHVWRAKIVVE